MTVLCGVAGGPHWAKIIPEQSLGKEEAENFQENLPQLLIKQPSGVATRCGQLPEV